MGLEPAQFELGLTTSCRFLNGGGQGNRNDLKARNSLNRKTQSRIGGEKKTLPSIGKEGNLRSKLR